MTRNGRIHHSPSRVFDSKLLHLNLMALYHLETLPNKTGLQPVSRHVEQILGFFRKVLMQKMEPKCVQKLDEKLPDEIWGEGGIKIVELILKSLL